MGRKQKTEKKIRKISLKGNGKSGNGGKREGEEGLEGDRNQKWKNGVSRFLTDMANKKSAETERRKT